MYWSAADRGWGYYFRVGITLAVPGLAVTLLTLTGIVALHV
jgi:hypothetical protein